MRRLLVVLSGCVLLGCQAKVDKPLTEKQMQWAEFDRVRKGSEHSVTYLIPKNAAEGLSVKYLTPATDLFPKNNLKWGYNYISHEEMTQEEAVGVVRELQKKLIAGLEQSKDDVIYFYSGIVKEEIDPNDIGVKITFWTDEYDRITPPFVAEAGTFDGVYYTRDADEKGAGLLPVKTSGG